MFISILLIVSFLAVHGLTSEAFQGYEPASGLITSTSDIATETTIFTTVSSTTTIMKTMTLLSYPPSPACLSTTSHPLSAPNTLNTTGSTGQENSSTTLSTLTAPSHNYTGYGPISPTTSSNLSSSVTTILSPGITSSVRNGSNNSTVMSINPVTITSTTSSMIPPITPYSNKAHTIQIAITLLSVGLFFTYYVAVM